MGIFGALAIGLAVIIPTAIVEGISALRQRRRERKEWAYYYSKYYNLPACLPQAGGKQDRQTTGADSPVCKKGGKTTWTNTTIARSGGGVRRWG